MECLDPEIEKSFESFGRGIIFPSALVRDQEARFDENIWKALSKTELFSLGSGSKGLSLRPLASAYYGLARGALDLPLVCTLAAHGVISRDILSRFGTEAQKKKYLGEMEKGRTRGAIGNSEPGAALDLKKIRSECLIASSSSATLRFEKPCVTNGQVGSGEGLFFVSAWEKSKDVVPKIAVYLVEGKEAVSSDLGEGLSAFRTALTGSIRGNVEGFDFAARRLEGNAFSIFRHCFNLERLFIGVIAAGTLAGLEDQILQTNKVDLEKLIPLRATRVRLMALVGSVLSGSDLNLYSSELAVLKMAVNEEGFAATMSFLELCGHSGLKRNSIAQKQVRDFSAFRFFGGSTDLQKLSLSHEISAEKLRAASPKKAG